MNMNIAFLAQKNISNLVGLWQLMGTTVDEVTNSHVINMSQSWPHRLWFDWECRNNPVECIIELAKKNKHRQFLIPLWSDRPHALKNNQQRLIEAGFQNVLRQHAMFFDVNNHRSHNPSTTTLRFLKAEKEIITWANIVSGSFGYVVDPSSVSLLGHIPSVQLIVACYQDQCIGSALLYHTGEITGVHYVGILPQFRRQGFAHQLMQHILAQCKHASTHYITLQASPSGAELYRRLGFVDQFSYDNYRYLQA